VLFVGGVSIVVASRSECVLEVVLYMRSRLTFRRRRIHSQRGWLRHVPIDPISVRYPRLTQSERKRVGTGPSTTLLELALESVALVVLLFSRHDGAASHR
jgi:hypothetical protein